MEEHLTFGTWLKRYRGSRGLTQREFANRLGYSVETYRKIEQGRGVTRSFVAHVTDYLNLPEEESAAFLKFALTGQQVDPAWLLAMISYSIPAQVTPPADEAPPVSIITPAKSITNLVVTPATAPVNAAKPPRRHMRLPLFCVVPLLLLGLVMVTAFWYNKTPLHYTHFAPHKGVYRTEGIFKPVAGTITVWMKYRRGAMLQDHVVLVTDDRRYALRIETYFSKPLDRHVTRIVARAGGNRRAAWGSNEGLRFPEASILIDYTGELANLKSPRDSPYRFPAEEWHHLAMTWEGAPEGRVQIWLDGQLMGEDIYDERSNDNHPPARSLAVGFHPASWLGEPIQDAECTCIEIKPEHDMGLEASGIDITDLRLYQQVLTAQELRQLVVGATVPIPHAGDPSIGLP